MPGDGITLFAYGLHSHLLGTAIQVDVYREGAPVGVLASDNNYDFNYQEFKFFKESQKIYPVRDTSDLTQTWVTSDPSIKHVPVDNYSTILIMC